MKAVNQWARNSAAIGWVAAMCLGGQAAVAAEFGEDLKWRVRVDMGGSIPQSPNLTEFDGPVRGQRMELSPGFQFDMSMGYRLTPWLEVGPELGFLFNYVDSFGDFSYHDTTLFQLPIMANVVLEYPKAGRLSPYIGAGVGGVASFLTFGDYGYYYYGGWYEPDGSGSDFVLGFQAFAGLRYRFNDQSSLGVLYRFLATDEQNWDVEWWTGRHFTVSVDPIYVHSICLVFEATF